ncbi:MAG: aminotransferase class V-fold PLP-dependent enzyme [Robiginitomaculum sp.]|nr:aminotransferase class V-fold PLP-dependent enzyme [Robiginitomaculum sp.]MDQ7077820.1 aminotransferase class V-fold PLP-dependent enzyme [Robiginitomaculum sp.]
MKNYREDFSIFQHTHYINSCSYGALSHQVEAAYGEYLNCRRTQGADWMYWCELHEDVRSRFAKLVNADADEVAVTTSASASLSSLISALDFTGTRNRVVTTDQAFPTEAQNWHAQSRRHADVVHARENDDGQLDLGHLAELVNENTLIVAVPLVCYRHGALNDIAAITKIAHDAGALMLVDGYQGLGAVPFDVRTLDVDFLIGGALKYLLSSAGIGYLYAREALINDLYPAQTGWFAQADIHAMKIHGNEPAPNARRFEQGTPSVPALYAAKAGLDYMLNVGVQKTRDHVQGLNRALKDGVRALGGTLACRLDDTAQGPMVAIRSTDDHTLVAALQADNIITSCRDGNLRVSAHFYNDLSDIEAVLAALEKNKALLA